MSVPLPVKTGRGAKGNLFGCGRINHHLNFCNAVGGKSALFGVLKDHLFVGCDVDAVDLVVCHVTLYPLNLWAETGQDTA